MRLLRRVAWLCGWLAVGCDSPAGVSGLWTGTTQSLGTSVLYSLTLTETDRGVVSGVGRFSIISGGSTFVTSATATGAHAHPSVSLNISAPGFATTSFQGVLDQSTMLLSGTLQGSGFAGDSLKLVRSTPPISVRITEP